MSGEPGPVFLARRAYFRRRLMDAARMLPVLGAGLFALPLLWKAPAEGGEGARTVVVMFYVFLCWIALTGLSWIVSRRLSATDGQGRGAADAASAGGAAPTEQKAGGPGRLTTDG